MNDPESLPGRGEPGGLSFGPLDILSKLEAAIDDIAERAESGVGIGATSTGIRLLDYTTKGFRRGQLIVLGSRPSMGRTTLALNICEHVACSLKRPVLLVNMQQTTSEIIERMLCAIAGIPTDRIASGQGLGAAAMVALGKAYERLLNVPLLIESSHSITISRIRREAARAKGAGDLGLVVVDEIQLVNEDPEVTGDRPGRPGRVARELKEMAIDLDVPVLALSQLEMPSGRRSVTPVMTDLSGPGSIQYDADVILLLHRRDYYNPNDQSGYADLNMPKNRTGPTDTIKLAYSKEIGLFLDASSNPNPGGQAK